MSPLQRIRGLISNVCFILFNRICCICTPLRNDQVCFLAETHQGLNGNLEMVYEYVRKHRPDLELLVYTKGDRREHHGFRKVLCIWKAISTAKYIFLDDLYTTTSHMKVRKGQEIVQLWHGAGAYKKFGHSRRDLQKRAGGKMRVHKGYRKYTRAIVSGSRIAWCYAEAFGMDPAKVFATGIPRMDRLYDEEYVAGEKEAFLKQYPELRGKKLVLFAPTYRGTQVRDADYDFKAADLDRLAKELGEEYVILTRWHPALKNNLKRGLATLQCCTFGEQIRDFTEYGDVNDLLIACDLMVTDYSSIIFDYFPLKKPVVYFAYDKEEYAGDRGLYYGFDQYVYGRVAENFTQLLDAIRAEDPCEENRSAFEALFLDSCDAQSTERVYQLVWNEK